MAAILVIGFTGLFGGLLFLWLWPMVSVVPILVGCVGTLTYFSARRAHRRNSVTTLARAILRDIKRCGLRKFELASVEGFGDFPDDIRGQAAEEVYAWYYAAGARDLKLTHAERAELDTLATRLALSGAAKASVEKRQAQRLYSGLLSAALADGSISPAEMGALRDARAQLGIAEEEAVATNLPVIRDAYLALFRRFAEDGVLSEDEMAELARFRQATGLSIQQAAQISQLDAATLFSRTAALLSQGAHVRAADRQQLVSLAEALELPASLLAPGFAQFDYALNLANISRGQLPTVTSNVVLRSTEVCHYDTPCRHLYSTRTRTVQVQGTLTVTDARVIFTGERSFEFRTRRILNVHTYTNAVDLAVSGNRGQGRYYVQDGQVLGAILSALVRAYNRHGFEDLDNIRSRHIPDDVKVAVWRRDAGRCVRCSAQEYLQFDHIIPFSKGGANTVENIQLLCQKCNLAKSDELV